MMQATSNHAPIAKNSAEPQAVDPSEILVVLPALNEIEHIESCIRSLMRPKAWMARCSLVVADGGSSDGTREAVQLLTQKYPNLTWIDNPGRLQSAGVNAAVTHSALPHHKYLIRCDVHAIYPAGYVQTLAEETQRVRVASVVTAMDASGHTAFQQAAAWIVDTPIGSGGSAHRGGFEAKFVDHGHHAAFDLGWFQRVGGYDPTISHNEDAEYDVRLANAGGTVWLTNKTRIAYLMRPTLRGLWQQYWNYGRGRANTLIKHGTVPRVRQIIPVANVWLLAISFAAMFVTPLALVWPILYATVLLAASVVGVSSLRSIAGLWAGPALGAMHLAWGLGFMQRAIAGPNRLRSQKLQNG